MKTFWIKKYAIDGPFVSPLNTLKIVIIYLSGVGVELSSIGVEILMVYKKYNKSVNYLFRQRYNKIHFLPSNVNILKILCHFLL